MNRRDFIRIGVISAAAVGLRNILPTLAAREHDLRCDLCGAYVITLRNFVEYRAGKTQCKDCSSNRGIYINEWMIIANGEGFCLDFKKHDRAWVTNSVFKVEGKTGILAFPAPSENHPHFDNAPTTGTERLGAIAALLRA